jgi:hypothetical protein
MVIRVVDARDDQDTSEFRGYPVTDQRHRLALSQVNAAAVPDTPSRTSEFTQGHVSPDPATLSGTLHRSDLCPGCTRGAADHYDFAARRGDPGMVGVISSRMIGTA